MDGLGNIKTQTGKRKGGFREPWGEEEISQEEGKKRTHTGVVVVKGV